MSVAIEKASDKFIGTKAGNRAVEYLQQQGERRSQVDESEFIVIYCTEGATLDQAWKVARARKNQRRATQRIYTRR
ncbi:gp088 [Rhodococcus phage ReqiDocB7]|uniref:gp088 n=1 Tax=Rhodococcus phage ReqiDocB7 TaxID=691966 RepID=UPI0001CDD871|nr:gp088 [Rhodococcus phage ReqiDocB7]ADD80874.1 gp088 [Rhodococcus phage ReqiDocB7]